MQVKKHFRFIHLYIRYSCKFYSPKNCLTVGAKQIKAVGKIKKKKLLQVQIAQYQILKLEIGPIWSQSSHLLNPIRSLLRFVLYSDPRFLLLQWHSQYIYQNSKLLSTVVCFNELVSTGLWAVWIGQHAPYTQFLPKPTRKESNVQKLKSS